MKKKLENGEYRSAQAMQKDFILIMQNCLAVCYFLFFSYILLFRIAYYYSELPSFFLLILKYNTKDSDIVKEAKRQTLMRPKLLKDAGKLNDTDVIW